MKYLAGLVLIIAIAAFATRPDAASLDDKIVGDLRVEASNLSVEGGDDIVSGIAKLTCSLSPADCARLIRAGMTIEVTELYLARRASVAFADEPAFSCLGAFTQWTCRPVEGG